jgi:hypothetical protein
MNGCLPRIHDRIFGLRLSQVLSSSHYEEERRSNLNSRQAEIASSFLPAMTRRGSILFILAASVLAPLCAEANPFKRDIAQAGNEAYSAEDYAKAVSEYLKAQDLEPLSAELHFNLGAGQYRQEEYEQAIEEFTHGTRADDPMVAAHSFYNLGNARYKMSKRDFEAAAAASAGQEGAGKNLVQEYVKKLEECITDYEESLKRKPDDQDSKYNLEMIRREIKNLMRRQPQEDQQQQQQQQQQNQENQENQDQQQQQQQQQEGEQKEQEEQQQQGEPNEEGTPTPQPMGEGEATPTPQSAQDPQGGEDQEPSQEPTQMMNISEEMARNILDNLPEQRPRQRSRQRRQVDKDW